MQDVQRVADMKIELAGRVHGGEPGWTGWELINRTEIKTRKTSSGNRLALWGQGGEN